MLIKEISIKNFRSYGNNTQTLKLNTNGGELILLSGKNGGGKSSLLSCFDYCLFNKVKGSGDKKSSALASLPNRINGSELMVKMKFVSDGTNVEIERGIGPDILNLIENGIPNDRAGKANLNAKIVKYVGVDLDTFKSFISMSINNFKNFISLSTEEKQILLDKLFNLEIINVLNGILKDLNKSNKSLILKHDTEINTLQDSIVSIQSSIKKSIEKEKEDIEGEINEIKALMNSKKQEFATLKDKVEKIKNKDKELKEESEKEREQFINIQNEIRNIQKDIDLYNSGKCPTCKTPFTDEHFTSLLEILIDKKKKNIEIKNEIEVNITAIKEKQTKLQNISDTVNKSFTDLTYLLKNYKSTIEKLEQKSTADNKEFNVQEFENTIAELNIKKDNSKEKVFECKEKELYYKELSKIFSDDGVKKSIISGIIKPINYFIAENIKLLGMPFIIELDETFNAKIVQFGIEVEHDSLSVGESKLINIAILMSYLMMIRSKKFFNILFLDEVFASIDLDNIEKILFLLKTFATKYNINIFVVHHAVMNKEYFDRIILIEKNVFSEIKEIE